MPLLPGGKVVEQILTDIQMPDDEEIVGITDNLVVEQEPIMAAAVSFNENAPETLAQELPMLDKVNCFTKCTSLWNGSERQMRSLLIEIFIFAFAFNGKRKITGLWKFLTFIFQS